MDNPIDEFGFLIQAEDNCLRKIAEVLGLRVGTDMFVSVNPSKTDCAVWDIGHLETGDQTCFPAATWHFRGQLDLYSRDRRRILRWYAMLMMNFPMAPNQGRTNGIATEDNSVVETLRIAPTTSGVSDIQTTELKEGNASRGVTVFTGTVLFDIIICVQGQ